MVFDCIHKKFRPGRPNDFCLLTSDVYYDYNNIKINDESHIHIDDMLNNDIIEIPIEQKISEAEKEVQYFFTSLFVNKDIRHYVLKYVSSFLENKNKDKIFVVIRGSGDNGKTIFTNVLLQIFDQYARVPPTTQLTSERVSSSGASSDWVMNKNARVLMYLEMESNTKINQGVLKFLTGGEEKMTARELYRSAELIRVNPKVIISTNPTWNFGIMEKAMIERTVLIPFQTTFVKSKITSEFEKRKDNSYSEKIRNPYFQTAFIRYIGKYYSSYVHEGLDLPEILIKEKYDFIEEGDYIERFLRKYYKRQENGRVLRTIIWDKFQSDYKKIENHVVKINESNFVKKLQNKGFEYNDEYVIGLVDHIAVTLDNELDHISNMLNIVNNSF
jgi:putative DNA primase/helicase